MSVKKLLVLAAASVVAVAASAALAGGPDNVAMPAAADTGVYVGLNAGYDRINWQQFGAANTFAASTSTSARKGGFTFGATLGYQWNQYLAAELGFQNFRTTKETVGGVGKKATQFAGYLAGKISVPVYDNTKVFGKLGVAARRTKTTGAVAGGLPVAGKDTNWSPMFAFGVQYMIDQNWSVNGQYMFIPGNEKGLAAANNIATPNAHVFTVGVDYLFQV